MNDTKKKVKKVLGVTGRVLSTLFVLCSIALCAYILLTNYFCSKNGTEPFYFGYRPCLIQTGSMEPYMMTNGIIMTKEVDSIDEIAVGDVVTYTAKNSSGKTIYITHRIVNITEDGIITTKGDNNSVDDGFPLTMDNIIAKTVGVYNQPSVWLINTWTGSNAGKVTIVAIILAVIFLFYAIGTVISGLLNEDEIENGAIVEYTKLCRKLGLSPAETFSGDLARLRTQLEEKILGSDSSVMDAEFVQAEGEEPLPDLLSEQSEESGSTTGQSESAGPQPDSSSDDPI